MEISAYSIRQERKNKMPLYDVYCDTCNYEMEIIIRLDGNAPACPRCGKMLKVATSCPQFVLKKGGVGWADTGYSNPNTSKQSKKK